MARGYKGMPGSQRGGGSLAIVLLLLVGASLVLLYANRALIFEQRAAANQVRAAAALQAAEAGMAWALARLNHHRAIDAACGASGTVGEPSFPERYLRLEPESGLLGPTAARGAACVVHGDDTWRCHCPAAGAPSLGAPVDDTERPAFAVEFASGPRMSTAWLRVTGCSHLASSCGANAGAADASVRVESLIATLGALTRAPYAALTARGNVTLQGPVEVFNGDAASAGLAVATAGDAAVETSVSLGGAPGSTAADALLTQDPTWRDAGGGLIDGERFFARHFGLDRASYHALPTVAMLSCGGNCGGVDLSNAIDAGARVLWVPGDLTLSAPVALGTPERPVVLIVRGTFGVTAAISLAGLVYADAVLWTGSTSALGRLEGALVSEGTAQVSGRVSIRRDAAILTRLRQIGVYAQVPGSWRDFTE